MLRRFWPVPHRYDAYISGWFKCSLPLDSRAELLLRTLCAAGVGQRHARLLLRLRCSVVDVGLAVGSLRHEMVAR